MINFTREQFFEKYKNDHAYAKNQWRQLIKLTKEEIDKFRELKKKEGEVVIITRWEKNILCVLTAVILDDLENDSVGRYSSYPFDIRLNPLDKNKLGFWTRKINNIELYQIITTS